jgi:hypothetical protein
MKNTKKNMGKMKTFPAYLPGERDFMSRAYTLNWNTKAKPPAIRIHAVFEKCARFAH